MSLINEALKRIEEGKAIDDRPQPLMTPAPPVRRRRRGFPAWRTLALAGVGAALLVGWMAWRDDLNVPNLVTAANDARPAAPLHWWDEPRKPADAQPARPYAAASERPAGPAEQLAVPAASLALSAASVDGRSSQSAASGPSPAAFQTPAQPIAPQAVYRLSAIIRGDHGTTAIINGQFCGVGSKVGKAMVVKIGKHTVELDQNGEIITIQM